MARNPKGSFKATLVEWQTKENGRVVRLSDKSLFAYTAFNERPKQLVIHVTGPDDMGREKDIIVDVKTLVADLKKHNLV